MLNMRLNLSAMSVVKRIQNQHARICISLTSIFQIIFFNIYKLINFVSLIVLAHLITQMTLEVRDEETILYITFVLKDDNKFISLS